MLKSPEIKHWLWKRLIDDIFFIWTDTEENLDKFLEDLNKFHPSLRFTYEKSREKISWMYTANSKFSRRNFPTDIIKSVSEYFKAIKKSHYSQLFSDDTHYNQEDYHRKQPASTQRPGDVP